MNAANDNRSLQNQNSLNIVFVQTAFIGDLFLSLPTLQKIKSHWPRCRLILVCKKGLGEFFLKKGFVDQVVEVSKGDRKSYAQAVQSLSLMTIDYLFCVHRSIRSSLFCWKIKAKNKIAYKSYLNSCLFSKTAVYVKAWPDVIRQMNILSPLVVEIKNYIQSSDWSVYNFKDQNGNFLEIPNFFSMPLSSRKKMHQQKRVALFPGSVWQTKKWTEKGFSDLAALLIKSNIEVILMGAPPEKSICQKIQKENPGCVDLSGQLSLPDSVDQISQCDLVVCNDSAPAHMAASVGVPTVALFGPTTLNLGFRPWVDHSQVVENESLQCRPCGAHGHSQCPLGHHECMKSIAAQTVFEAVKKVFNTNKT